MPRLHLAVLTTRGGILSYSYEHEFTWKSRI